jgi:hypothetical protein
LRLADKKFNPLIVAEHRDDQNASTLSTVNQVFDFTQDKAACCQLAAYESPLKYLKHDFHFHDKVMHFSQCGCKLQVTGQWDCGRVGKEQICWTESNGMSGNYRALKRERIGRQ